MKNYSEKEICIFSGILSLCKEGKKIYNITVQDIATAANVGKGTLYEYFSSKEDIILNAITYFLVQDTIAAENIAAMDIPFKAKVFSLYDLLQNSMENGFAMISRIVISGDVADISQLISRHSDAVQKAVEKCNAIIMEILKSGADEGAIKLQFDSEYIAMAIKANLACVTSCQHLPSCNESVCQIEQKKQTAYTLLLKSLN